jgi:hypothetical protein
VVLAIEPVQGVLPLDVRSEVVSNGFQDRRLGGQATVLCESCERQPAIFSRRWGAEVYLICWSCR